jgi:hypothetical protein
MLTACPSPAYYITVRKEKLKKKFLETYVVTFSFLYIKSL